MRHSPHATAILLLAILGCAVAAFLILPRRSWCRHLCPLGGLAGICSTTGLLEIRPTADICAAKCKGHECYKGDRNKEGCPMFNHVMFLESSQHCVLCMKCVLSCPHNSPQCVVRTPHHVSWTGPKAGMQTGMFIAMLLGLMLGMLILQGMEAHGLPGALPTFGHLSLVTAILTSCAAIPLLLLHLAARRVKPQGEALLWQGMAAWVPLLTAGFAALQLAFLPGLPGLVASMGVLRTIDGSALPMISFSVLSCVRLVFIAAGLAGTIGVLRHLKKATQDGIQKNWMSAISASAVTYATVILLLMIRPEWLLR